MFKVFSVVILIFFASIVCVASEPPIQKSPESGRQQQGEKTAAKEGIAADKRGTTDAPLVIEVIHGEKSNEEKSQEAKDREVKESNDRITIFSNVVIAVFTVVLAIVSFFQWKVANKNASAADLNARAAIGVELPILRAKTDALLDLDEPIPENDSYGGGEVAIVPRGRYCGVGFITYKNFGRTPAFPTKLETGYMVAARLPERPIYQKEIPVAHAARVSEEEWTIHAGHTIELTDVQKMSMLQGSEWLWFYGRLTYHDFMGAKREAKFCWRFAKRHAADSSAFFSSDGDPPEKYLR